MCNKWPDHSDPVRCESICSHNYCIMKSFAFVLVPITGSESIQRHKYIYNRTNIVYIKSGDLHVFEGSLMTIASLVRDVYVL